MAVVFPAQSRLKKVVGNPSDDLLAHSHQISRLGTYPNQTPGKGTARFQEMNRTWLVGGFNQSEKY